MFIKLTLASSGPIYINFDNVESFGIVNKGAYQCMDESFYGLTYICPVGIKEDERPYIVMEAPREIMEMLWKEREK